MYDSMKQERASKKDTGQKKTKKHFPPPSTALTFQHTIYDLR